MRKHLSLDELAESTRFKPHRIRLYNRLGLLPATAQRVGRGSPALLFDGDTPSRLIKLETARRRAGLTLRQLQLLKHDAHSFIAACEAAAAALREDGSP